MTFIECVKNKYPDAVVEKIRQEGVKVPLKGITCDRVIVEGESLRSYFADLKNERICDRIIFIINKKTIIACCIEMKGSHVHEAFDQLKNGTRAAFNILTLCSGKGYNCEIINIVYSNRINVHGQRMLGEKKITVSNLPVCLKASASKKYPIKSAKDNKPLLEVLKQSGIVN